MEERNQNPRPWSELTQDLLITIANTLISDPISIRSFRSVCRSWRTSCSPPLPNSSILSPLLPHYIPLTLSVTIIYALQRPEDVLIYSPSNDTWIIFVDEFIRGRLSIRKPFSTETYFTPINFPTINWFDFEPCELGRFHNLSETSHCCSYPGYHNKPIFYQPRGVKKVLMFPNELAAIILRDNGVLEMYRLNVGIHKCEIKHNGHGFKFDDIVEYKSRILGIDRRGRVYQIEYLSSVLNSFITPISGGGGRRKRLVESLGLLYLIVRCKETPGKSDKRRKFKVYELNEGGKKWCEITSLGDRSFSFGFHFSFSASAKELGTNVKNSILFTMNSFRSYEGGYDDEYKDFSKLEYSNLAIGVWQLDDKDHLGAIESNPDFSDSLWPPPSWIWNVSWVKRIGIVDTAIKEMRSRVVATLKAHADICAVYSWKFGGALAAGEKVINLRKMVIRYHQEGEITFMHEDRESEDKLNKEFQDIMSKVGSSYDQQSTTSHEMNEASLGRNAFLFHIEDQVTKLEMTLDVNLRRLQT